MQKEQRQLGVSRENPICDSESQGEATTIVHMGEEVRFRSVELKAAFESLATDRQKQYIAAYVKTGSPTKVRDMLGLTGSVKGVSSRLRQIAKQMGLKSVRVLKPDTLRNNRSAVATDLMSLIERQDYRCALSGVELTTDNATLDHIDPIAYGGSNDANNLQWVDESVNKAKGTMSQEQFIALCSIVSQWNR